MVARPTLLWSSWQAAPCSHGSGCEVRVGNIQVLDQRPSQRSGWRGRPVMATLFGLGRILAAPVAIALMEAARIYPA
ncbi:MAG: hypothetical protein M3075_10960 [Candidatus Dormibacteraeota bacterium]|nr:hypothetical protein [Candidatus Dormibacteraeota bacterium]